MTTGEDGDVEEGTGVDADVPVVDIRPPTGRPWSSTVLVAVMAAAMVLVVTVIALADGGESRVSTDGEPGRHGPTTKLPIGPEQPDTPGPPRSPTSSTSTTTSTSSPPVDGGPPSDLPPGRSGPPSPGGPEITFTGDPPRCDLGMDPGEEVLEGAIPVPWGAGVAYLTDPGLPGDVEVFEVWAVPRPDQPCLVRVRRPSGDPLTLIAGLRHRRFDGFACDDGDIVVYQGISNEPDTYALRVTTYGRRGAEARMTSFGEGRLVLPDDQGYFDVASSSRCPGLG